MPHSPPPTECWMYLIRHGATANNVADPPLLQGRSSNPELSAEGRQQAQRTADFLASHPIGAVYSSPMLRAQQTADIIAERHNPNRGVIDDIIEIDVGDWEMRSWIEISKSEPEAYARFMADPATNAYEGGESLNDVHQRVLPALNKVVQQHLGQVIVVVAHNVVNRVLLADLLDMPISKARGISQDNCGINVVRYVDSKIESEVD